MHVALCQSVQAAYVAASARYFALAGALPLVPCAQDGGLTGAWCAASLQALEDAAVAKEQISTVEVVGGSSRVPAVTQALAEAFGMEPSRTLNAKECVSRGAALQCAMLSPIFR